MRPQGVEQRFAFGHAEAKHVSIRTATKKKCLATGLRIGANHRMMRPRRLANIGDLLVTLAQHTCTVSRSIMHSDFAFDSLFKVSGQALVGCKHVGEISVPARLR